MTLIQIFKKRRENRDRKETPGGVIQRPPLILRTNVEKPKHGTNLRECVVFSFQVFFFGSFELFFCCVLLTSVGRGVVVSDIGEEVTVSRSKKLVEKIFWSSIPKYILCFNHKS